MKHAPFILAAALAGILASCERSQPIDPERPAGISAVAAKPGDDLIITGTPEEALLIIHSETGIGRATITRGDRAWPDRLVLRLHLRDLEGLELNNGMWRADSFLGNGPTIDARHLDIVMRVDCPIARNGEVIEVIVPELFLDDDQPELHIQWVDYYRN